MVITRRAVLAAALATPALARGQEGPTRPCSLIIPWAPGGGTDLVFRAMAPLLGERIGQPVAVVNRPGGSGAIGHMAIRTAVPDGTTFGAISAQLLTAPLLGPAPLTWHDIQPLALVNVDAAAFTVRADAPWRDFAAFIAHARANPEAIRIGNSGPGGSWHIASLELERRAGIKLTHTPYAGAAPGIRDLLGGHIDAVAFSAVEARAQIEAGQVRVLALCAPERIGFAPEAPTAAEQGYPIDIGAWRGLALPLGVPAPIQARLGRAVAATVADARFQDFMRTQGFGIRALDAAGTADFLRTQEGIYRQFFSG